MLGGRFTFSAGFIVIVSTLLAIDAQLTQAQTKTVLYTFTGGSDGGQPQSRLILDSAGNLYGTTLSGGVACPISASGCGTVFKLSPDGTETVLHAFTGGADGAYPSYAGLVFDGSGNLYGTASLGGTGCTLPNGCGGVVFELSPSGAIWKETVLYNFCSEVNCADGQFPGGPLLMDTKGSLYGSTWEGVFELSPSAGGAWNERIIYPLSMVDPSAGLVIDASGDIFGIGSSSYTGLPVFELSPDGDGGWNGKIIHTFPSVGNYYSVGGTLALNGKGNLFGTIDSLINGYGHVYKLTHTKTGTWQLSFLPHSSEFYREGSYAGVVLDEAGNVYGAARSFVYEYLAPDDYLLEKLGAIDGGNDVILDSAGNLYGTDSYGGSFGSGTVFEINPSGSGTLVYVDPISVDFGEQLVGTTSNPKRISLFNKGSQQITVKSVSVIGSFTITTNYCTNGVKPSTHCDVYVVFTPTRSGVLRGTLTFDDNSTNSPQMVALSGTGD